MSDGTPLVRPLLALILASMGLLLGCSPKYYRAAADAEVYGILEAKQARALGAPAKNDGKKPRFTIEPPLGDPLEALRQRQGGRATSAGLPEPRAVRVALSEEDVKPEVPEDGVPRRPGALMLTLSDARWLAARQSRTYQEQKEELYLVVLALTLERHRWTPQLAGSVSAGGTAGGTDSVGAGTAWSVSQLLALGGEVTVDVATDLLKVTSGGGGKTAASALAVRVLQPLWRGHGRIVAQETLTQAERDALYAVRSFARFRKTFFYRITSEYYGVLRSRDSVSNEWQNYQQVKQSVERTEGFADAGRRPEFEVDQARQDLLAARDRWVQALRRYSEELDRFKVQLTLPADAPVELDPQEVKALRDAGLREVALPAEGANRVALERRLDLLNAIDRVADAERKLILAVDGLAPDVDLTVSAAVDTPGRQPLNLRFSQGAYSAGLEADLPLNRKEERNAYRASLIALEASRRAGDQQRDDVVLNVRDAWRNLQETAARYRIQEESLKLAEGRVRMTRELLQANREGITTRDVLEALRAQLTAQNGLTGALIDNTLARLAFWRDTELLDAGPDGELREPTDVRP